MSDTVDLWVSMDGDEIYYYDLEPRPCALYDKVVKINKFKLEILDDVRNTYFNMLDIIEKEIKNAPEEPEVLEKYYSSKCDKSSHTGLPGVRMGGLHNMGRWNGLY